MELGVRHGRVEVELVEEGDSDREDVLLAADSARWAADALERYAGLALLAADTFRGREPSVEVECLVSAGKPLVRWVFGWVPAARPKRLYLAPPHALALARLTRLAAGDAARKAKEIELREPRCLLR